LRKFFWEPDGAPIAGARGQIAPLPPRAATASDATDLQNDAQFDHLAKILKNALACSTRM